MSCRSERSIAFLLFVVLVVQVPSLRAADVQPIVGSVPPYVTQAADQGPADSAERLHLVVVLRMQDEATMRSLADSFRVTPLTHAQVIARFSPSITQSATVVAWLRSQSLNVTSVSDDRTLIEVEATVGLAEEAFGVSLHEYRVGNHTLLSSSSDPLVPADIAPGIQAIVGLSEAPLTTLLQLSSQASTLTSGSPPFGPADLRNAYDVTTLVSSTADGRGKAIAITGWGPADQVALNEYDSSFGLPAATITYHDPSGGASCGGGSNVEWDLDVQMEHAMSPGASIHSYCGSAATLSAMLTIIGRVVTDNTADVISQSWGTCEGFVSSATASAYETKLTEAAAQGQAFFTSSGDGGSRECTRFSSDQRISPSFPATAPHTTSVGGTALTMSGSSYSSESAWNTCTPCSGGAYAASGGGRSQYFSRPSWQSPAGAETMRASPDWSADADPATGVAVRSGGAWYQVGGTSVSSPMLAGLWGDLVSAGGRLGNAGPKIWGASSTDYATVFRDITTGTNGDFSAGPGYDFPTGLGPPRGAPLVSLPTNAPLPPTSLVEPGGNARVDLSWGAPTGTQTVTGYRIYRGLALDSVTLIASVAPSFAYADQALAPGTTYYYVVTATNGTAEGIGAQATAWTFGPPRTGPTGISIVPGAGSLSLSWSPPTDDGGAVPTDYSVYAATGSTQATDGPGLVGHEVWTLQMDADDAGQPSAGLTRDAGPGGEHGVLHGVSATTGRFGAGYRFAGVNQWISVPDTVAMPQGTIMVWVNASDLSQEGRIVFKEDPGTWIEMLLNTDPTTHYIGFETDHAAPSVISSTPLQAGVWTHIAATWGPGGRALYINGVLDASDSSQVGVGSRFTQTMIGNSPNDVTTGGFNGVLDEFREYDVQLDADMINTIMMTPYLTSSQLLSHTGTTTSYSDRGLGPLTMRSYRLAASNGFGEGALSAPAIGVTLPTSIMPSGLTVAVGPGEGQLSLAWDAPTDPSVQTTGYRIERGSSAVSIVPYVDIGTITTFVDSGIPSGTLEYYDVRALTANGTTDASSIVSARTFGAPLAAPTSPAATTGPGSGDITFTWSPPAATISEPISGFHVLRCDSGDELLADVTIHTFTDHGLGVNSTHCYRVSAFNDYGAGPPSATASATTFALPAAPSTPWTVAGAKSITVRWAPPAYTGGSPISLYRIYASNASGQEEPIGTTTGTTLTETGLANGQKRYYLITAETIAGEGPMSGEGSGKSLTPPGPPRSLKATPQPTTREVLLTWSPPLTANEIPMTSYRVYRGTAPGDDTWLSEVGGRVLTYTDRTCDIGVTCYYRVTAVGAAGEGPKSGAASAPGTSLGVGVPGSPSDDSADTARLIGHEITVLQMDSDDYDHPLPGMTSDSSLAQDEGLITGATLTSGRFGEGLLFQGTGQYVSLRDALTSDLAQGTVMMWVNAEDLTPGHLSLLLKVLPGVFGQLGVQVSPDGRVAFFTSLDGGSTTLVSGPGSVRAGEWTHIAVTWGPLGKRIIVNGQLVASNADTVGTGELSSVTEIGIDPNDHAHTGFHGVIDEFRIYDAQLADGEVLSLMAYPYAKLPVPAAGGTTDVRSLDGASPGIRVAGRSTGSTRNDPGQRTFGPPSLKV